MGRDLVVGVAMTCGVGFGACAGVLREVLPPRRRLAPPWITPGSPPWVNTTAHDSRSA
ncbi:hypothetical protein [Streptomyces cellulosae]|uniref:Uncharacterized protein n=1 Tax=Streptomyces cellulosae TaxID=1968 RepID=A0ABW7YEZ4_STRCE